MAAPGSAPVLDPCGVASGSWLDNTAAGGVVPPGQVAGAKGSLLRPDARRTEWTAGATVEVEWVIDANHGGGYHYRLCPASVPLTEECFSRTPLRFAGTTQQFKYPNGTAFEIAAVIVSEGTLPAGSQWARNPIPACREPDGGFINPCGEDKLQFAPPPNCDSNCWGYGTRADDLGHKSVSLVDRVVLPADLAPGDYVVGWRWDSEHTPQVWSQCGDVTIVAAH